MFLTDAQLVGVRAISRIIKKINIGGATEIPCGRRIKKHTGGYNAGREEVCFHQKTLRLCGQRNRESSILQRKVSPPLMIHPSVREKTCRACQEVINYVVVVFGSILEKLENLLLFLFFIVLLLILFSKFILLGFVLFNYEGDLKSSYIHSYVYFSYSFQQQ